MATPGAPPTSYSTSTAPEGTPSSGPQIESLVPTPKLLRASLLSSGEQLLRETRATALYFLPGPIIVFVILLILFYGAWAATVGWAGVPYETMWLSTSTTSGPHLPSGDAMLGQYIAVFIGILALLALIWILVRYLLWIRTVYAVTTSRVVIQRGIVSRDFDEIPVNKIRAVEVHQGPLQRLFGYGTIKISSEGENRIANEAWRGIPKPWEFQRLINGAAEKYGR
jgi:membrane protein YdbS with pleckstrin-like domain